MSAAGPPFGLSVAGAVLHGVSALCCLLLIGVYLRFRVFSLAPSEALARGYVRLVLSLTVCALLLHAVRAASLAVPLFGGDALSPDSPLCQTLALTDLAALLLCLGFTVTQAVNLHRVFLLRLTKRPERTERWYYAGVIVCTAALVAAGPIAAASAGPMGMAVLQAAFCPATPTTDKAPGWLTGWNLAVVVSSALALTYIIAVVAFVDAVIAFIRRDLRRQKKEQAFRANHVSSYKEAYAQQTQSQSSERTLTGSWIDDYVSGQRSEDKSTLAIVRHITVYPTLAALTLLPAVAALVDTLLLGTPGQPVVWLRWVAQLGTGCLGLGLFLCWALDPSLWSVAAAERDALAARYVAEQQQALHASGGVPFTTSLRHAWERIVWLSKKDLAKAQAEARRAMFEQGIDPDLPLESNDVSDEDPMPQVAKPDPSHLRRGSVSAMRAAAAAATQGGGGPRRPSLSRRPSHSPLAMLAMNNRGQMSPSPLGASVRRPSNAMAFGAAAMPGRRGSGGGMALAPGSMGRRGSVAPASEDVNLLSDSSEELLSSSDEEEALPRRGSGHNGNNLAVLSAVQNMRHRAYSTSRVELDVQRPRMRRPSEML